MSPSSFFVLFEFSGSPPSKAPPSTYPVVEKMQRQVIVDDTDPQIQYIGIGWFKDQGNQGNVGNFGPTYMETSHGTIYNDSLSFSFNGTSVSIYGTTNLVKINNGSRFDPTLECFVDEISIGSTEPFEFPESHWLLCGRQTLSDGPHTITANITTTGNTFWFDYLTYTPSPKMSFDEATLLVDNGDPALLFGTGWGALGGTANMTTVAGSQAKFDFIGKSISWVGFVPRELPHGAASGSFIIDNSKPVKFKLDGLSPDATTTVYNQVFFATPVLAPGPHSLIVTYNGGNGPSTPLTLDYLYVTNTSATVGLTPTTTSNSQNATNVHDQSKKPPVGAIVGGITGGLAFIFLILFLLWLLRWRRHIKGAFLPTVNPFLSTQSSLSTSRDLDSLGKVSYVISPTRSIPNIPLPPSTLGNNASTKTTGRHRARHKKRTDRSQASVLPVLHQDSGVRLPPPVVIEDIPPRYTFV